MKTSKNTTERSLNLSFDQCESLLDRMESQMPAEYKWLYEQMTRTWPHLSENQNIPKCKCGNKPVMVNELSGAINKVGHHRLSKTTGPFAVIACNVCGAQAIAKNMEAAKEAWGKLMGKKLRFDRKSGRFVIEKRS